MLYPMYKVTMGVNDYVEMSGNHSEGVYRIIWWTRRSQREDFHKRRNKSREFGNADAVAYLFLLAGKREVRKWDEFSGGYEPFAMCGVINGA